MKRSTFALGLTLVLPLLTALGCAVEGADSMPEQNAQIEQTAQTAQALSGFTFDSRALAATPPATLPTGLLSLSAFSDDMVVRALVQTTESFTPGMRVGTMTEMVSANYKFEKDAQSGAILVLRTTPTGAAAPQDEAALQRSAVSRVGLFGIRSPEIGRTLQRRTLQQTQDDKTEAPELHRYKTFMFRAINRIPVEGHRAVITHATDGSFVRAFLKWPAVATSGHLLTTPLAPAEIERRAITALNAEGETKGSVRLSYKYVPTQLASGEVVLTLKASARLAASAAAQEAREIDVDIDAR